MPFTQKDREHKKNKDIYVAWGSCGSCGAVGVVVHAHEALLWRNLASDFA